VITTGLPLAAELIPLGPRGNLLLIEVLGAVVFLAVLEGVTAVAGRVLTTDRDFVLFI
jgi:hypothetical protein